MSRENFLQNLKVQNFKNTEIINSVRIVHKNLKTPSYDNIGNALTHEVVEMYDFNGNRFYTNCSSMKEAEKLIIELKSNGKEAVIGPVALSHHNETLINNNIKNTVGVYIVNEPEIITDTENEK